MNHTTKLFQKFLTEVDDETKLLDQKLDGMMHTDQYTTKAVILNLLPFKMSSLITTLGN